MRGEPAGWGSRRRESGACGVVGAVKDEAVATDERVEHWEWRCQQTTGREDGCLVWAEAREQVRVTVERAGTYDEGCRCKEPKRMSRCRQWRRLSRTAKCVGASGNARIGEWRQQRRVACDEVCERNVLKRVSGCVAVRASGHMRRSARRQAQARARGGARKMGVPSQRPACVGGCVRTAACRRRRGV